MVRTPDEIVLEVISGSELRLTSQEWDAVRVLMRRAIMQDRQDRIAAREKEEG